MLISVHFKLIKQNKSTAMRCMDNTALPCRMSPTFSLLPQRAVPVSGTRSQGGYSLLKRECPPPRPPKEKRGGISISPRTPLKRHKGRGPWPPAFGNQPPRGRGTRARPLPFGNPSRSWTEERQRKEEQGMSYLHPVVLHARRCGGALI